ncbi:DNA repair protein rad16 [Gnomoniopsis smithogilvyi]|uniref:DNA repair protein rad16 n=1 Tax=Gnomoniopsis smithogilvyi TaxID=1191159 RepID=A0A9W8YMY1_9PEZI|nr:DNA repair protein rad16 [Gnomoniopsis smithogilvyi]
MPRTRRSLLAGTGGNADTSLASNDAASSAFSPSMPAKRPRGRPSKASLAAAAAAAAASRDSVSSITTSNDSESVSGYSTPFTSNAATPAESNRQAKLEVVIPVVKSRDSAAKAMQKAKDYMMGKDSKKKRIFTEIADSEDDDLSDTSPITRRTRNDEHVARQLQEDLDREAAEAIQSQDESDDDERVQDDQVDEDSDDLATFDPKGKGRSKPTASRSRGRAPTKLVVSDSEDDEEDFSDSVELEPPTKKRKTAVSKGKSKAKGKGKAKMPPPPPPGFDDDEDDDIPLRSKRKNKKIADTEAEEESAMDTPTSDGFDLSSISGMASDEDEDQDTATAPRSRVRNAARRGFTAYQNRKKERTNRGKLESQHPQLLTMWTKLEEMVPLKAGKAEQPKNISRLLKPFQLEGLAWMKAMEEQTEWKGGLLGDEMGLGKTIQAVSLIMSDYPAKQPSLVLVPPVALMQWVNEIESYTDGTLKTLVMHGTNTKAAKVKTIRDLKKYDVILMSYNSLESMYRRQEKGYKKKDSLYKEKSLIHSIQFHRVILDEAHCIKTRTTMTAKATFALKVDYRWCLTGTPLQNRIGEFFSLIRFLNIKPFASYFCKHCPCESVEWKMDDDHKCTGCKHNAMQHVSVFNQEILNHIQRYGNSGPGKEAFRKLRLMTDRIMLRRLKKDHTDSMELPVKEIYVDRQFFGEAENDFANSIMTNGQRNFDTYVAQGVLLNNYANIFGLIMQMRQVADHPDLILKKNAAQGQNVLQCNICDEPAEDAVRSRCKHDFCRACARAYLNSQDQPDCPRCHIPLSIDLEQPEIEQDEALVKKSSIINRIKMENWVSSSKIELLVHELHKLRSDKATHKSIIFSQFTTMLQLIEWRLRRAGITTVMLDGSMTPAQRAASIDHFMKNVDVECFLVSLKAGGVALNLTEASHVFIIDPWWNPAAEWQSADRCHRIGQSRPCTITRLCIEDSVESRMVLLQEKKTNMINSTINSDDAAMESLSPEDLQFLFRGS